MAVPDWSEYRTVNEIWLSVWDIEELKNGLLIILFEGGRGERKHTFNWVVNTSPSSNSRCLELPTTICCNVLSVYPGIRYLKSYATKPVLSDLHHPKHQPTRGDRLNDRFHWNDLKVGSGHPEKEPSNSFFKSSTVPFGTGLYLSA